MYYSSIEEVSRFTIITDEAISKHLQLVPRVCHSHHKLQKALVPLLRRRQRVDERVEHLARGEALSWEPAPSAAHNLAN